MASLRGECLIDIGRARERTANLFLVRLSLSYVLYSSSSVEVMKMLFFEPSSRSVLASMNIIWLLSFREDFDCPSLIVAPPSPNYSL
jgi:hypothetical protein